MLNHRYVILLMNLLNYVMLCLTPCRKLLWVWNSMLYRIIRRTWSLLPTEQARTIVSIKWFFKVKQNADGSLKKIKARLVTWFWVDYMYVLFWSRVKQSKLKVFFCLAVTFNSGIKQVDVNNTFLNGTLGGVVYILTNGLCWSNQT